MKSEKENWVSAFMVVLIVGLISQNLVIPVMSNSLEDQKNYYGSPAPDPSRGTTPPSGSHRTPSHGTTPSHGSGSHGTTPSHGSGSHGTTPSHGSGGYGSTPPSHGGGGSYHPTPSNPPSQNCGTPTHTPATPSTPSNPPSGGGYYHSPPTSGGGYYHSPPTSGGGYNPSPPTSGGGYSPSPPTSGGGYNPSPPSSGGGYNPSPPTYGGGTPPTPVIVNPPTTPIVDPGTPSTPVPTPPFFPTPSSPFTGTCNYWRTHPGVIWGLLGWWGTLGSAFGVSSAPGFGATATLTLPEALSNTRTDGLGALYREGTAAFLNSMVNTKFPFTTKQVRDRFVAALSSNKAAESLAKVFKLANEGRLKPKA